MTLLVCSFSRKIFVGGIGWDTSEDDLKSFFGQFGEVAHVQVKYDHFTGRSRGFAFVEFTNGDACREVSALLIYMEISKLHTFRFFRL